MTMPGIGTLRERLVIEKNEPLTISIASVSRSGTTATATTAAPHGYATNDYVTIAGAVPTAYNGRVKITVTTTLAFTYSVSGSPTTPASGTMTVVYYSDAQGGRRIGWTTVDTVPAELIPLRAMERLQAQAISAQVDYRFRIRVRTDVTAKMRALWTPRWPPGSTTKTLEIHGVLPADDGRRFMLLEAGVLE